MNTDSDINKRTELVIGCAYRVGNTLGSGFLEKVYENALSLELRRAGINVAQQQAMKVVYLGEVVGEYIADMVVEDRLVVEVKAVTRFDPLHMAQCMNYLKATGMQICLLINFGGSRVDVKRIVSGS